MRLAPGDNAIEVSCTNKHGAESFRAAKRVVLDSDAAPRLFVATLGVSQYDDPALALGFAHKDAADVAAALAKRFSTTKQLALTNGEVGKDAVGKLKDFFAQAEVKDTVVLFFAGHGMHDAGGVFYALPQDVDPRRLAETAIPFAALESVLAESRARSRLLLLDACESGDSDELQVGAGRALSQKLVARGLKKKGDTEAASAPTPAYGLERDRYIYADLERRSGTVVIASSRGDEWSFEDPALGHGLFSHALLTALADKKTDENGDGKIAVHELVRAAFAIVRAASEDRQHPMVQRDNPLSSVRF